MTDSEIIIADKILQFAKGKNSINIANQDFRDFFGENHGLAASLCDTLAQSEFRLLNKVGTIGFFSISELGKEVVKIGLKEYLDSIRREKDLDIKAKIATIDSFVISKKSLIKSNIAIWLSVLAILISIGLFLLDKYWDMPNNIKDNQNIPKEKQDSKLIIKSSDLPNDTIKTRFVKIKVDSIENKK